MPVVVDTRGDPKYVDDVIVQRWQQSTGGEARHAETGRPFSASGQIAQSADRKISRKRAADRNHADASYATGIERSVGSVRHKVLKATLDSSPLRLGAEGVPVGLRRPGEVLGAQMNAVFLAVTEDVELDPLPSAGVDALTIGCARSIAICTKPPLFSRLTPPRMRIAGRPATASRTIVPLETPPITRSVNNCQRLPIARTHGRLRFGSIGPFYPKCILRRLFPSFWPANGTARHSGHVLRQ
jgi:hypothetical protein